MCLLWMLTNLLVLMMRSLLYHRGSRTRKWSFIWSGFFSFRAACVKSQALALACMFANCTCKMEKHGPREILLFNLLYTLFHLENPEDLQEDSEIPAWGKMLLDPVEGPRIKASLLNFLQLQSSLEVFQENLYPVQENLHLLTYLYDLNPKFVR